jgi:hypothetical protein
MLRMTILAFSILITVALTLYAAILDTSEFHGLGFLFLHMLVFTPLLLFAPLAVHIRAPVEIRKTLWFLNVLVIVGLAMSWVALLTR